MEYDAPGGEMIRFIIDSFSRRSKTRREDSFSTSAVGSMRCWLKGGQFNNRL